MTDETLQGRDAGHYDPAVDPVATVAVVLTVECHPKRADMILDFLRGVKDQPGVYAAIVHVVNAPAEAKVETPPAVPAVPAELPPELRPGYIVPIVEEPEIAAPPAKKRVKKSKASAKKKAKPRGK